MRVFVTGGNGDLGRRVVSRLVGRNHEVLVGSREPGDRSDGATEVRYDFADEAPLAAVPHADAIVHLATDGQAPQNDVDATRRLVEAAAADGVGHLVYMSIVGIDDHPFPYYRAKLAVEKLIEAADVPWTIQRATQFHSLVPRFVDVLTRGPVTVVPSRVRFQPIDAGVVADRLVELVEAGPSGRVPDLAGPQVLSFTRAARAYLRATGSRRPVIPVPYPGAAVKAFRRGDILAPDIDSGGITFDEWLAGVSREDVTV